MVRIDALGNICSKNRQQSLSLSLCKKAKLSPSEWNGVMTRMYGRLYDNIENVKSDSRITFSEFGTRRAASTDIHRQVNAILASELPGQYLGTSNVMISMEMGNANPK